MNLNELKAKYNLTESHLTLLFDVLFTYHEFDMLYSFEELETIISATKIFDKPANYFVKAMLELMEMNLIEFVNDGEAKFFVVSEEIRGIKFFKELEQEVC